MPGRRQDSHGPLLALCVVIVVTTAALYVWLLSSWLSAPAAPAAAPRAAAPAPSPDESALAPARRALREDFLDPRSWLELSRALARAGRPIDAFYLTYGAREFFGDAAFFNAHAAFLRRAAPAADPDDEASQLFAKAQAAAVSDPMTAIPLYARSIHADPRGAGAQKALDALQGYASASEDGPQGEASRLAREALEELRKAHADEPAIFSALASALLARGDRATAQALVVEAGRKKRSAAVARIEGLLALSAGDADAAVASFTEAWEKDPDDLVSAEKLASLYADRRGDEESALPYEIALYRHDPRRLRGVEPLELAIRRALDARRTAVLRNVGVEGLGRYLDSDDASLRAEAAARAGELKDARWIDALAERLDDDTEIVRHNAEYALYQIARSSPEPVKVRRDDWLEGDRPLMRARVLNLFADLWPNETMPLALKALDDPNPAVRYFAKTLVFDRYYRRVDSAQRAEKQYLLREKDPLVLAMLGRGEAGR